MATTLPQQLAVEGLLPWQEVRRALSYGATPSRQAPYVPEGLRGDVLDDRQYFVHLSPDEDSPHCWPLDEPLLTCLLSLGLPWTRRESVSPQSSFQTGVSPEERGPRTPPCSPKGDPTGGSPDYRGMHRRREGPSAPPTAGEWGQNWPSESVVARGAASPCAPTGPEARPAGCRSPSPPRRGRSPDSPRQGGDRSRWGSPARRASRSLHWGPASSLHSRRRAAPGGAPRRGAAFPSTPPRELCPGAAGLMDDGRFGIFGLPAP